MEKIIPRKQEKKNTCMNSMKRVLFMKAESWFIGTHKNLVCCKQSHYIVPTRSYKGGQEHSVYLEDK